LKITTKDNAKGVTLKLEGRIVGPWAAELDRYWQQNTSALRAKSISLDLRDTTFADADGIRILRAIYAETGAAILTGTLWTQHLADEITRNHTAQEMEEV
jgi:anti-anti-sigma regulatory factor